MSHRLPSTEELKHYLDLKFGDNVEDLVTSHLVRPLQDLLTRPSKNFRGQLVDVGYRLSKNDPSPLTESESQLIKKLSDVIEFLHAASLAVDDIQDQSPTRRGAPSLHVIYGVSVALNAGNWLYFWPFEEIKKLSVSAEQKLEMYENIHKTLMRAHFGQALDVGVAIDRLPKSRIAQTSLASVELKSGALMALPLTLGAQAHHHKPKNLECLSTFGHGFGVALQMFNDIGNIRGHKEPEKQLEDIALRRPSWLWAFMSQNFDEKQYEEFLACVNHLPEHDFLTDFLSEHDVLANAKTYAVGYLNKIMSDFERDFRPSALQLDVIEQLKNIGRKVSESYD